MGNNNDFDQNGPFEKVMHRITVLERQVSQLIKFKEIQQRICIEHDYESSEKPPFTPLCIHCGEPARIGR